MFETFDTVLTHFSITFDLCICNLNLPKKHTDRNKRSVVGGEDQKLTILVISQESVKHVLNVCNVYHLHVYHLHDYHLHD